MGVTTNIPTVQDNIESWGVSLDVPSLTPANLDGGTGSISFTTRLNVEVTDFMEVEAWE